MRILRRMTCKTSVEQVWTEKMLRELWKDVAYADYIGGAPWVQCVIIIYCDLALGDVFPENMTNTLNLATWIATNVRMETGHYCRQQK